MRKIVKLNLSVSVFLIRVLLGGLLIISGLIKIFDQNNFGLAVVQYNILPINIIPYFIAILPTAEYLIGTILLIGFYPRIAAIGSSILFTLFGIAVGWNLIKGNIISCGCFGSNFNSQLNYTIFVRDVILFLISFILAFYKEHKYDALVKSRKLVKTTQYIALFTCI